MAIEELHKDRLIRRCDPDQFQFETTDELEPLGEIIGQPRAVEAVRFGIDIRQQGYNIFALGPAGVGKHTLVGQFLERKASEAPAPPDWCYVNNFDEPYRPRALRLPAGKGNELRDEMDQLIEDVLGALSAAFESDEYQKRKQQMQQRYQEKQQETLEKLREEAYQRGLEVMQTPGGLAFAPQKENGETMDPEEIQQLSEQKQKELEEKGKELQQKAQELLQNAPRVQRQARQELKELNQKVADNAVEPCFAELREKYQDLPKLVEHLAAVKGDIVESAEQLLQFSEAQQMGQAAGQQGQGQMEQAQQAMQGAGQQQGVSPPVRQALMGSAILRRYRVNVLIHHDPENGAPLVHEDQPNYPSLIGRVDYMAQMGTLVADFNLIKPGALHRANGGYLVLDAYKVLTQPRLWQALKRAIRAEEVRIESLHEAMGLMRTVSLEPEPIPLDVKIVLTGRPMVYHLLRRLDPEFAELFKVPADFDTEMDRNEEHQQLYARLIATLAQKDELKPFTRDAVARVVERASRVAGDSEKLSVHMRRVADLLVESHYWAGQNGNGQVTAKDVDKAIANQVYRSNRVHERLKEQIERDTLLINTDGQAAGQINGLALFPFGDFMFGRPTRITARTRMGKGEVIDIEREVELGGPVHSKGVLILQGFLSGRYAQDVPLSLSASLVFEQSYGSIGGDSASSAELYALLSSIAGVELNQGLAVTGSVNQHGVIQPIGGVNEKIEGFFQVCRMRGLTGKQGVLIPQANVKHLMLDDEVVEAVNAGQFHIYSVQTVDDGVELLSGLSAGEPDEQGDYPPESFNGKVMAGLREFARRRKEFAKSEGEGE
ncbi:MAG: AAA family ATPase [Planctomycetota bacterium]